jgi:hypothetical protein
VSLAAVALVATGVFAQAKPNFAGEWKKVAENGQGEPGVDLIITQNATSMTVEYPRGQTPAPVKLTYKLDDATKATWAANKLVVKATTAAGDEQRTFSMDGSDLVVETSAPTRKGAAPIVTRVTYQKYQRGYGG